MKLGEEDLPAVLGRVAELARQTLPGTVGTSVTVVESDRAFTAAFAGQLALDLDGTQCYLSVALPLQESVLGALNIYATQPAIFDRNAIEMARTFAGYAAVAIANARLYQRTATLAEHMRRAMESRAVIEQAKGILIAQQHCTPEQAFDLLVRLSQSTHRKLRDCAADLVASTAEDRPR
jgi:GAF domain-containing protein